MKRLPVIAGVILLAAGRILAQGGNPPPPSSLLARNASGHTPSVSLSWQVSPGPWSFKIYRSATDSNRFEWLGWSMMPGYQDRNVLFSTTYYYYVTTVAYRETLVVESSRSNIAGITVSNTRPHGTIRGSVFSDSTGQPLSGVRVRTYRLNFQPYWSAPAVTNSSGQYQMEVDTGSYFLRAEPPWELPYRAEWYNNAPTPATATPLLVTSGASVVADFGLASHVQNNPVDVRGVVTTPEGVPVPNASVVFMRTMQEMNYRASTTGQTPGLGTEARVVPGIGYTRGVLWQGQTNQFGQFTAHILSGASYLVAAGKAGYVPEYFSNEQDPTRATILQVQRDTSGINFSLAPYPSVLNSIRGTVRDTTGQPIPSRVILFPKPPGTQPPATTRFVHSDTLGAYEIDRVFPGTYILLAVPYSNFSPAYYKESAYGVIGWQDADSLDVDGSTTGINVGVLPLSYPGLTRVSGTVTSYNGQPVPGGRIIARAADGSIVGYGVAEGNGSYFMEAIPSGQLTVYGDRNGYTGSQGTLVIPPNVYGVTSNFVLGFSGPTPVVQEQILPLAFRLRQNYPNPFNPSTVIEYSVPRATHVTLKLFNVVGQEVKTLVDEEEDAGVKKVRLDGSALAGGVYMYQLTAGAHREIKKAILLK